MKDAMRADFRRDVEIMSVLYDIFWTKFCFGGLPVTSTLLVLGSIRLGVPR